MTSPGNRRAPTPDTRRRVLLANLRRQLDTDSFPRLQMALLVMLTGTSGLLWSFVLLRVGIDNMALRYPLALIGAYGVFIGLLWLWLRTTASNYADAVGSIDGDVVDVIGQGADLVADLAVRGGGGRFGGGGASGGFDGVGSVVESSGLDVPEPIAKGVGAVGDADELAIPLLIIALVVGLALATGYLVYIAPSLFAELLFDGALSYSLYRKLRHTPSSHWVTTAIRRTALPFALTGVLVTGVGWGLRVHAPEAHTLGEALRHDATANK